MINNTLEFHAKWINLNDQYISADKKIILTYKDYANLNWITMTRNTAHYLMGLNDFTDDLHYDLIWC